ncbi:MAG: DUF1080 domain-containing protein [Verrucomicrobia bacterium]|nr:DUF1080 domain-containing protein [Verrucomicrobiota bacterium]
MKTKSTLIAFVAFALAAPLFAAEPNTLTAAEKSAGWKLLFDGKTLDGWRGYKTEAIGAGWKVQDGTLAMTAPKSGDLVTKDEFGDFEFSFEWKISETGNSGVIYRSGFGESASYRTGPEYQVLDNQKAEDNKKANHLAGSLYDIGEAPAKDVTKPVGEWNVGKIVVRGWHIEHWLNGVKLVDQDLSTAKGKADLAASKFKDWPKFASLSRGHIALQEHNHLVFFRSLKIRELK